MDDELATRVSLLQRVKDPADQRAWQEFVERYAPVVYAWARRHGLQENDAEEATARVLLKLCQHLPKFDYDPARGRFRAYLSRVLRSAVSEMFREWRAVSTEDTAGQFLLAIQQDPAADEDLVQTLEKEQEREMWRLAKGLARERCEKEHVWLSWSLTREQEMRPIEAAKKLGIKVSHLYMYVKRVNRYIEEEVKRLDS